MLPLVQKDTRIQIGHKGPAGGVGDKVQSWFRLISSDKNSRNLFLFLILNLSFAFVELFYGIWTNSLGKFYNIQALYLVRFVIILLFYIQNVTKLCAHFLDCFFLSSHNYFFMTFLNTDL